jgi:glucoamylase
VRGSLNDGADEALAGYVAGVACWQDSLLPLDAALPAGSANTYRISTAVLRTHEARSFAGGYIASLSIPWGFAKGDEDLGGYHLVWPRDLVETRGGMLAAGRESEARQIVRYPAEHPGSRRPLAAELLARRHAFWSGVQMDECAFPSCSSISPGARARSAVRAAGSGRW